MDLQEQHLSNTLWEVINNARQRCQVLEGKDRYALQVELLEWMSGGLEQIDVMWLEHLNGPKDSYDF